MKKQLAVISLLAMCVAFPIAPALFTGCATKTSVAEGSEVFVVNAQQSQEMAWEAVNTFLNYERANRDALWALDPGIKKAADELRATWPEANKTFLAMLDSYKNNRTAENRASVTTWLAILEQAKLEAYKWLILSKRPVGGS